MTITISIGPTPQSREKRSRRDYGVELIASRYGRVVDKRPTYQIPQSLEPCVVLCCAVLYFVVLPYPSGPYLVLASVATCIEGLLSGVGVPVPRSHGGPRLYFDMVQGAGKLG